MDTGFVTLKDWLQVILVPAAVVLVGVFLPKRLERQKSERMKDAFVDLICREMNEMGPEDADRSLKELVWSDYLRRRFIHEAIFRDTSENRDFIINLDPNLAYYQFQLWMAFDKAFKRADELRDVKPLTEFTGQQRNEIGKQGAAWCHFLNRIISLLDEIRPGKVSQQLLEQWRARVKQHHTETDLGD